MDITKLRRVESAGAQPKALADAAPITAIIKVREAGYRPAQVRVRTEIDDQLFTADFLAADLGALEADPLVEAISVSKRLPLQKAP